MTRDPAVAVMVDRSNAKLFAVTFSRSSVGGDAEGPPGAVVGVPRSTEGGEPDVPWVGMVAVVTIVAGLCIGVPVGRAVVEGIVVGTGVTSLPWGDVQPAHHIAARAMQIRSMRDRLFMHEFSSFLVLQHCCERFFPAFRSLV